MYIPEFWCGVIMTVLVEIALTTIMIVISTIGKNKGGKK